MARFPLSLVIGLLCGVVAFEVTKQAGNAALTKPCGPV
jgi:hypothetical protein